MRRLRFWLAMRIYALAIRIAPDVQPEEIGVAWGDEQGKPNDTVYFHVAPFGFHMPSEDAIAFADGVHRAALNSNPKASPLGKHFASLMNN